MGDLLSDAEVLLDFAKNGSDSESIHECIATIERAEQTLHSFELERMLSGEHDSHHAILEINSGAGGTEAQDWGEMLLRM